MSDLLPPSATKQERALASISERIELLPVIYRKLWNPDLCPVELLPYLAWAFSLDDWNDKWPEHIKRQSLKDALYQHRIKGSLKAVENAIARFGTTASITEWWQQSPKGTPHTFSVDISAQDNERQLPVYEETDSTWQFCSKAIPVNTSRVYRIQAKVRITTSDAQGRKPKLYIGCVALDKDFKAINFRKLPWRHVAVGPLDQNVNDGWVFKSGEITGEGNGNRLFGVGTEYIRPYVFSSHGGAVCTSQIAEIELWDLFENRQLIPNPRFENGKQGWSKHYEDQTVPDNAPGAIKTAAFRPDADFQTDIINAIKQAKPLRSDFNFNVGTVHPAPLELSAHVHQVVLSRETWE